METKYFVARAYRYKESGNWEYSLVGMYNTLSAAKQAWHPLPFSEHTLLTALKPGNSMAWPYFPLK